MNPVLRTLLPIGIAASVAGVMNAVLHGLLPPYIMDIVVYTGINITAAVSLNLVNGITGQFSMGHAGFMAIGGYVSAVLTMNVFSTLGIPFLPNSVSEMIFFGLALLGGGAVSAALGFVVGMPSLRLRGDYLAIVTLGFGEIIRVIILNINFVGGARGLPAIPKWSNFGWVYFVAFLCIFFVQRLMSSRFGRALLAVREDEIAAEAAGVNTTRNKVGAFMIGAFFAGISGGLFGHYLTLLNPSIFDFNRSFEIIIMVVLGGMGSISGAVLAAAFLTPLREVLRDLQKLTGQDYRMVIYSLLLIVLMLTRPNGFFGSREISDFGPFRRLKRKVTRVGGKK